MYKKYAAIFLTLAVAFCSALAGCADSEADAESESTASAGSESSVSSQSSELIDLDKLGIEHDIYEDSEHEVGYQTESPDVGEEIAVIHTTMGDITMRFFPEAAPMAVENFLTHAEEGYYEGIIFHRVIDDFMIQGGDPTGTGTGGESINGEAFNDEFSDKLFNIRGSVSMANSGADTNGSQFFINQGSEVTSETWEYLDTQWQQFYQGLSDAYNSDSIDYFMAMYGSYYNAFYNTDLLTDEVKALYEKYGGNPSLDGAYNALDRGHTVFAQVIDGMDVVDAIAAVETDENDKPLTDVVIESIEVTTYKG